MPRDYRKARERNSKKVARGAKSSKTVPLNRPSGIASGTKSSRPKLGPRSPIMYGVGPNNQGVVKRKEHYEGIRGTVAHGPKRIKPLKPKQASPIKGRDIPLPKSKF